MKYLLPLLILLSSTVYGEVWDRDKLIKVDGQYQTTSTVTVKERFTCTMPTTRVDGEPLLPSIIAGVEWRFTNAATGSVRSLMTPACPVIVEMVPATYKLESRVILTTSEYNRSEWQVLTNSLTVVVPGP